MSVSHLARLPPLASLPAFEGGPRAAVLLALGGLGAILSAEGVTIATGRVPVGIAVIAVYGLGLLILAVPRPDWAIVGLLAAMPLVTVEIGFGNVARTLSADKVALAAVLTAWLAARWRAGLKLAGTPAVRAWAGFLVVAALSTLANGVAGQLWGVSRDLTYALIFLAALDAFRDEQIRRAAMLAAGVTAGIVSMGAMIEWKLRAHGHLMPLYFKHGTISDVSLPGSTIAHVNFLGGYLVLLAPVLAALCLTEAGKVRAIVAISLALCVGGLLYAQSMGAWVGAGAGVVVFGWRARPRTLPRRAQRLVALGLLLVAVLATAVVAGKAPTSPNSFGVRVAAHRVGLAAIADRPLLGHGADGYARQYYRYEQAVFGRALTEFRQPSGTLSAHSSFLDVAVSRGLLGLAAFVALLAAVVSSGLRAGRDGRDAAALTAAGAVAGVVAFVVQAFTENLFSYSKVTAIFWILAAALVSLAEAPPQRPR